MVFPQPKPIDEPLPGAPGAREDEAPRSDSDSDSGNGSGSVDP